MTSKAVLRNAAILQTWTAQAERESLCAVEFKGVRKKKYATLQLALDKLRELERMYNHGYSGSAYKCKFCDGYHLTSQRPPNGVNGSAGCYRKATR